MGCFRLLNVFIILYCYSQILGCPRDSSFIFRKGINKLKVLPSGRANDQETDILVPSYYGLNITVGTKRSPQLTGDIKIKFSCRKAIGQIQLDGKDMEIKEGSVKFSLDNGEDKTNNINSISAADGSIIISLKENMEAGKSYILTLSYEISMSKAATYYFDYDDTDETGEIVGRYFLLIPNDKQDAADAFPCFNQRRFAAFFDISITRPSDLKSLSNMELKTSIPIIDTGEVQDIFKTSPKMNVVSVTMIIHSMTSQSVPTSRGLNIRVYSPVDKESLRKTALIIIPQSIQQLENYFKFNLPLEKIDNFPASLTTAAALSSLGVHIFDKDELLITPDNNLEKLKFKFDTFAHELTHQWFGNLIYSPDTENGWITEAFADLMGSYIISIIKPEFKMIENRYMTKYKVAQDEDCTKLSHPLTVRQPYPVNRDYLDLQIAYLKGSSILRMVNNTMGSLNFQTAVQEFLQQFLYKSATALDFFTVLSKHITGSIFESNNINLRDFTDTWTEQMGYPVITLKRDYSEEKILEISQNRYLNSMETEALENEEYSDNGYTWQIPVSLTSPTTDYGTRWLQDRTQTYNDVKLSSTEYLLADMEKIVFARVNYDNTNWKLICDQLQRFPSVISVVGRAGLVDDAFKLAEAGLVDITVALCLTQYLPLESDSLPMKISIDNLLKTWRYVYDNEKARENLRKYGISLLKPAYDKLNWNDKTPEDPELTQRVDIFEFMCRLNYEDCVKNAQKNLERYLDGTASDKSLKNVALCTVIRNDKSSWQDILDKFPNYETYGDDFFIHGLSCTEVEANMEGYIEYSSSEKVGKELKGIYYTALAKNIAAIPTFSKKLRDQIDAGTFFSGEKDDSIIDSLPAIVQNVDSLEVLPVDKFNSFNKEKYTNGQNVKKALNIIFVNRLWQKVNKEGVIKWLSERDSSNSLDTNKSGVNPLLSKLHIPLLESLFL